MVSLKQRRILEIQCVQDPPLDGSPESSNRDGSGKLPSRSRNALNVSENGKNPDSSMDFEPDDANASSLPPSSHASERPLIPSSSVPSTDYKPQILWTRKPQVERAISPSPSSHELRRSQRAIRRPQRTLGTLTPPKPYSRTRSSFSRTRSTPSSIGLDDLEIKSESSQPMDSIDGDDDDECEEEDEEDTYSNRIRKPTTSRMRKNPAAMVNGRWTRRAGAYIHYGAVEVKSEQVEPQPPFGPVTYQSAYQDLAAMPPLPLDPNDPDAIPSESCIKLRAAGIDPNWCVLPLRGEQCPWGAKKGQCKERNNWNKSSWERHVYGHLPDHLRPYWQCPHCVRTFARRDSFKRHFRKDVAKCWTDGGINKVPETLWEEKWLFRPVVILFPDNPPRPKHDDPPGTNKFKASPESLN